MEQMKRLPIGLEPRYVIRSRRITDIIDAMERYSEASYPIPMFWISELREWVKEEFKDD